MEGPFAEFPGYSGGSPSPKPAVKVQCITHRNDPVYRGAMEGSRPGFPSEDLPSFCHCWSAVMWNSLDSLGVRGITDVWVPPVTSGTHIYVQINKQYRGHAKQIASAIWGHGIGQFAFKNVIVVEQDIDLRDPYAIEWAIAYRVNAGEGGLLTWGPTFGSPLDPSTPHHLRDPKKYGSGHWTRMLIDATRSWELEPNPKYGGKRFPPVTNLPVDLEQKVCDRWDEYGIGVPYLSEEKRELLTFAELSKVFSEV
jgi:4-hydroxy-3-polyprenylbenzoate decarboxylase